MDEQQREIIITIMPDGNVAISVRGAHGSVCMRLTEELEHALGDLQERRLDKAAFAETPEAIRARMGRSGSFCG